MAEFVPCHSDTFPQTFVQHTTYFLIAIASVLFLGAVAFAKPVAR